MGGDGLSIRPAAAGNWELNRQWFIDLGKPLKARDCPGVFDNLREGERLGDPKADEIAGELILDRICFNLAPDQAVTRFRKAAEHGFDRAILSLGLLYERGVGVPQDERKSRRFYRLGFLTWGDRKEEMRRRRLDLMKDVGQSVSALQEFRAIEDLWAQPLDAQRAAAQAFEGATMPDPQAACLVRLHAAGAGSAEAAMELGLQLLEGRGVPKREAQAARWLHIPAAAGQPSAQAALGHLLVDGGKDLPPTPKDAVYWLLRAKLGGVDVADALAKAENLLEPKEFRLASASSRLQPSRIDPHHETGPCW